MRNPSFKIGFMIGGIGMFIYGLVSHNPFFIIYGTGSFNTAFFLLMLED